MDTVGLPHPAAENPIFEASDEDTFEAVMEEKWAREANKAGGGEVSNMNYSSPGMAAEPGPTRIESLRASLLLKRYLAHINDPPAWELEAMLGEFGRKTRVIRR